MDWNANREYEKMALNLRTTSVASVDDLLWINRLVQFLTWCSFPSCVGYSAALNLLLTGIVECKNKSLSKNGGRPVYIMSYVDSALVGASCTVALFWWNQRNKCLVSRCILGGASCPTCHIMLGLGGHW